MGAPPAPWRRRDVDAAQEDVALAHHLQDCLSWRVATGVMAPGRVSATQAGRRGRADALPPPLLVLGRERPVGVLACRALCLPTLSVCCFVLLVPTWLLYRVPRVSPGVTAPNLRLLPSLATPVPPSSLQTTPDVPVLLSEGQSGVQHLLGLIRGVRREGRGSPFLPWWLRWIAYPPGA